MAIQFFTDKIKIGDFTLYEGNGGLQFDGVARAEKFRGKSPAQGYQRGYFVAGYPGNPPYSKSILSFPFANEVASATGADITEFAAQFGSQNSDTHGYRSGGFLNHPSYSPPTPTSNTIDKFPFANNNNATDVGDLNALTARATGSQSKEQGFNAGGYVAPGLVNTIDKFPFATDANATDHGDLVQATGRSGPSSSPTHGYLAGGEPGVNTIQKFPFASTTGAKDVGDLTIGKYLRAGCSSETHGYAGGGVFPGTNILEKFSFSTDTNATDVGDLLSSEGYRAGVSSITFGYIGGGSPSTTQFQKFPFATDNSTTSLTALPSGGAPFGSNQV